MTQLKLPVSELAEIHEVNSSVAILTPQFYQFNSTRCLFGGGERYLIDLAKLLQKIGYTVEIFQPSTIGKWSRIYHGITINGISQPGEYYDFYIELNKQFYILTKDFDYHLYFSMDTLYPNTFPNSLCISHGIWWDSNERKWWRSEKWYNYLFQGLSGISTLVSVDTNTIKWINAVNPDLKCNKVYIPNYVDLEKFKPDIPTLEKQEITVLFPRRLCSARGWAEARDLALDLTNEYKNLIFSFVGRASSDSIEQYMKIISYKNPRIKYTWFEMDDMAQAYKDVDIVLIPSVCSEGTSLSLLEAMACGKPVIAGLVGGLTDLVINGYNGYLIKVTPKNLKNAVIDLIENQEKRIKMGRNAYDIAQNFSKKIWEEQWTSVLLQQFSKYSKSLS